MHLPFIHQMMANLSIRITMDNISEMTPEALLQRFPAVQQLLGTTKEIFEADSLRFHKKLQKYVDSSEKTSTKSAKEMEYWPLIKVVRLVEKTLEEFQGR